MLLLLLGARFVTVDKLAAELERGAVRPVLRHFERRIHPDDELVLILEPYAFAVHDLVTALVDHRLAVRSHALRLDLHAVVAQLGIELGFDGKEVLLEDMPQVEGRHQRNGVVTARHRDPRVVVRGKRALHPAVEFEVVALLADRGTLGTVAGAAEITLCIDRRGADFVFEDSFRGVGLDFVDRDLCRHGIAYRQGAEEG